MQYNTIQYNTIQYNTIQYNTIQYNTIQYCNIFRLKSAKVEVLSESGFEKSSIIWQLKIKKNAVGVK